MDAKFITLDAARLAAGEHICCAISDKKCAEGYDAKKRWLAAEFPRGYIFRRLDERAKVFIEYGPAESAWVPLARHHIQPVLQREIPHQRPQRNARKTVRQTLDGKIASGTFLSFRQSRTLLLP